MKKAFAVMTTMLVALACFGFLTKAQVSAAESKLFTEDPTLAEDEIPMYIMDSIYSTFPNYYNNEEKADEKWQGSARMYPWNETKLRIAQYVDGKATGKYYAAYFTEIYRSGIGSMPIGQYEAAEVLGYSKAQTFFTIILPQVIKRILPSITNEIITLVKDTSLAFAIAQAEMFTIAKQIAAAETSMLPLAMAGVFYYIFNLIVATIMEKVEKAFSYYR